MKRILTATVFFGLVLVLATAYPNADSSGGSRPEGSDIYIDPAIWEALEDESSVEVYIALRGLEALLDETTLAELRQHAGTARERVLSALGPEDFELVHAHELFVLAGRVTESGLVILIDHPDVRGVEIPGTGETWVRREILARDRSRGLAAGDGIAQ